MPFDIKDPASLTTPELIKELDPHQIFFDFRWTKDIEYQKKVALEIEERWVEIEKQWDEISQDISFKERVDINQKLAVTFMECGLSEKSEKYYRRVLEQALQIDNADQRQLLIAQSHFGIGVIARELRKNTKEAEDCFEKALNQLSTLNSDDVSVCSLAANIERNRGIASLIAQQYGKAMQYFQNGINWTNKSTALNKFSIPLVNYLALATVRYAETVKARGEDVAELFAKATNGFKQAREMYLQYSTREELAQGCHDWGSHVYHSGLAF